MQALICSACEDEVASDLSTTSQPDIYLELYAPRYDLFLTGITAACTQEDVSLHLHQGFADSDGMAAILPVIDMTRHVTYAQ